MPTQSKHKEHHNIITSKEWYIIVLQQIRRYFFTVPSIRCVFVFQTIRLFVTFSVLVANPARGLLDRSKRTKEKVVKPCSGSENKFSLVSVRAYQVGIWPRETGSAVPSRVSLLIPNTQSERACALETDRL